MFFLKMMFYLLKYLLSSECFLIMFDVDVFATGGNDEGGL